MEGKTENRKLFRFEEEGVTIILPDEARNVGVRRWIRPVFLDELPATEGVFTPHRLVISIEFHEQGVETATLAQIGGRTEIHVRYTPQDVIDAGKSLERLKLAYFWNGEWRPFLTDKHSFELIPDVDDPNYGEGVAYVVDWNDPAIGWGD